MHIGDYLAPAIDMRIDWLHMGVRGLFGMTDMF